MVRKKMARVLAALIALLPLAGLSLYGESPHFIESPQRIATAGQFFSDTDLFMDPHSYADLEFGKWFGAISFHGNHDDFRNTSMAQLGFAVKFGGLYMGLYYAGNTWNIQPHEYMEINEPAGFFPSVKSMRSYTDLPLYVGSAANTPRNEASVLIGFADMGIRLSFISTHWSRKLDEDFKANANYYKSFSTEKGSLNPEIAWGMARELVDGRGIKPHAYVDLDIYRDYVKYERYTSASQTAGEYIGNSDNHIKLGFTAALGGFSLLNQNDFDFGVDLWYTLGLTMYDNEYNYTASGIYQIGKNLKGRYDGTNMTEESEHNHLITPYLYASWSGEKLALSAELGLEFGFGGNKTTAKALKTGNDDGTLVKDGPDDSTSYFAFSPVLSVGMKWEIVAGKFFLNAGGGIGLGILKFTTSETVSYVQDVEDASSAVKKIENTYEPASTALSIGVTLNPSVNLSVQAICGVDTGNIVTVFKDGSGLAVFSGILVTVKF